MSSFKNCLDDFLIPPRTKLVIVKATCESRLLIGHRTLIQRLYFKIRINDDCDIKKKSSLERFLTDSTTITSDDVNFIPRQGLGKMQKLSTDLGFSFIYFFFLLTQTAILNLNCFFLNFQRLVHRS